MIGIKVDQVRGTSIVSTVPSPPVTHVESIADLQVPGVRLREIVYSCSVQKRVLALIVGGGLWKVSRPAPISK